MAFIKVRSLIFAVVVILSLIGAATPLPAATCEGMNGAPGDIDGDGFVAAADCDDSDRGVWTVPGEVANLRIPAGSKHVFVWDAAADSGGSSAAIAYDVLRSSSASNFSTHPSATCVEPSGLDRQATDTAVPLPGQVFFYLARERSQCGPGSLGARSNGAPRAGRDCSGAVFCTDGNACTKDRAVDGVCVHDPIPPVFVHAPASTATCVGGRGRFATEIASEATAHYAWRKNGAPVGVDSPQLDLPSMGLADNGAQITVQVTDACSSATSPPATLTVFSDTASCAGGLSGDEAPNGAGDPSGSSGKQWHQSNFRGPKGFPFRVSLHSGELQIEETDLAIAGRGFDFAWTRLYRSREWRSTAMGAGWTHAYDRRIALDVAQPGRILVYGGDARIDSFAPNVLGCYDAPGFFEALCPQPDGSHVLTFPDGMTWTFSPLDGSAAEGRIVEARDTYGNAMTFAYDTTGRLTTITDTLGRAIQVAYNPRSLVESVTDFAGRSVHYAYYDGVEPGGDLDDLKSVTSPPVTGTPTGNDFPQGKKSVFTYSSGFAAGEMNHNLTSVVDGLGQTVVRFAYSLTDNRFDPAFDRLYRVERPDGASTAVESYAYVSQTPSAGNGFALSKTVVKDPEGNVGEYFYDDQRRLVRVRDFTGRAPNVSGFTGNVDNRPTGQLRPTDPPFFVTRIAYNADFLPTQLGEPNGNSVLWTYDSANPSPRKRGDLLHETEFPGPLGGDQPQIDRSWVHGTSFGTDWGGRSHRSRKGLNEVRDFSSIVDSHIFGGTDPSGGVIFDFIAGFEPLTHSDQFVPELTGSARTKGGRGGNGIIRFDDGGEGLPGPAAKASQVAVVGRVETPLGLQGTRGIASGMGHLHQEGIIHRDLAARGLEELGRQTPFHNLDQPSSAIIAVLTRTSYAAYQALAMEITGSSLTNKRKGWDGLIYGNHSSSTGRLTNRRKGWDGLIYGNHRPAAAGRLTNRRKGWDGLIYGNHRAAPPTHPTSYTDGNGQVWTAIYDTNGGLTDAEAPLVVTGTLSGAPQTVHLSWAYDTLGQLVHSTDPEGRVVRFDYVASGPATGCLLREVVDPLGLALTTTYDCDALLRPTRATDPNGHATDFVFDPVGNLVRVTESAPFSYRTEFYYDANDRLVRTDRQNVDEFGTVRTNHHLSNRYDYDALGRLVRDSGEVAGPQCVIDEFAWSPNDQLTLWRKGQAVLGAQPSNVVSVSYDEKAWCFRVQVADGADASTTQFDYDGNGNLAAERQGLEDAASGPNVTTWQYDGYDRLVHATDAEGNEATVHYDTNGNETSSRVDGELIEGVSGANVRLFEVTFDRDEMNRPVIMGVAHFDVSSGTPIGDGVSTRSAFYDASSRVVRSQDDNGNGTDFSYDSAGRLSLVTDPRGNTVHTTYDPSSNVVAVADVELSDLGGPPATFVTQYEYDALDRLTAAVDNVGGRREALHDSRNIAVRQRDQLGNVSRFVYDGVGRLVRTERDVTDTGTGGGTVVATQVTTQAWDDSSRLLSATDPNGNTIAYAYNARDRRVAVTLADGTTTTTAWDVHENPLYKDDSNGTVENPLYDGLGRVVSRSIVRAPGVVGTTTETYRYDGMSRRVLAQDDDSLVTFAYDSLSNVNSDGRQYGGGPVRTVTTVHDGAGNRKSVTDSSGHTTSYSHDALDRVKFVLGGSAGLASYDYFGPDRLARVSRANGTTTDYAYDGLRRLVGQTDAAAGLPLIEQTFAWSAVSAPVLSSNVTTGVAHAYQYDSLHRLAASTRTGGGGVPQAVGYQLDASGNRLVVTGGPEAGPYSMSASLPEPADFQVHQYTTTPRGARSYDRSGNTLVIDGGSPSEKTFGYDYDGRVCSVAGVAGSATFAFDALGDRLLRAGSSGPALEWVQGPHGELEQFSGGAPQWSFRYGAGGELLSMEEGADVNGNGVLDSYFLHKDHAGNVVAVSDAAGALVERYDYDDYGKPRFFDGAGGPLPGSSIGNPFLSGGRRYDAQTGLYLGTEDFDPQAGTTLSTSRLRLSSANQAAAVLVTGWGRSSACPSPGLGPCPGGPGTGPVGKIVWVKVGKEYYECYCDDWYRPKDCSKPENWYCVCGTCSTN